MPTTSSSIKILIITEDQKRRFILRKTLQIAHYDVITAENEVEGLYLPSLIEPDVIILDTTPSKLNTFILLERLKNDPMTCSIPIIFLTNKKVARMKGEVELGGIYYVKNPSKLQEIQACIRKALADNDEMERFRKSIQQVESNLASILVQKIRYPIMLIAGFADLMNQQCRCSDSSVSVDYLQHIIRQADHVKDLIEDFNYLLHSEQMIEEVDLIQVVQAAMERFCKQIEEKRQKIELRLHTGDRLLVHGKSHHLFMALRHLISNAHKFTYVGGTITVEVTPMNGRVRIEVADTGVGISQSQQRWITGTFHQDQQGLTGRYYRGKGLGLVIARSVVDQHQGGIGFDSRPGLGSRFWIDLPLCYYRCR
jgi:signal transduction histidine kinase